MKKIIMTILILSISIAGSQSFGQFFRVPKDAVKLIILNNSLIKISKKGITECFMASYAQVTNYNGTDLRVVLVGKNVSDSLTIVKHLFYSYNTFKSSRRFITFNKDSPEEVKVETKNKELRSTISSVYKEG